MFATILEVSAITHDHEWRLEGDTVVNGVTSPNETHSTYIYLMYLKIIPLVETSTMAVRYQFLVEFITHIDVYDFDDH